MFKKAQRKRAKLKIGISGPSGSGKTYSALRLAKGFGGKVAVLDTERGSASLYSDQFNFDVVELEPPFTTEKYIEVIKAAEQNGYDILIIDSASHAWAGEGGILNQKEQLDSRGGNSFANWSKMTPKQERFLSAIIQAEIHIICTVRAKQEYAQGSEGGKTRIQRIGLAPIQRDGFEYEFTTFFNVAVNHEAETSKDRTGLFDGKIFTITEDIGTKLKTWLESAEPIPVITNTNIETPAEIKNNKNNKTGIKRTMNTPPASQTTPDNVIQLEKQKKERDLSAGDFTIKVGKLSIYPKLSDVPEKIALEYLKQVETHLQKPDVTAPSELIEIIDAIKRYWGQ